MSTSRIEVPLTLPPPHFDDDETIATARQVVPLKGAGRIASRRKILTFASLLIASTLCGALGALGVSYLDRRRNTPAPITQQQAPPKVSTEAKTEPTPIISEPVGSLTTGNEASIPPRDPEEIAASEPAAKKESPEAKQEAAEPKKSAPPAAVKREPDQDAAKLVRKRRVTAEDSEIPLRRNRRTAGRIEDIFTGPNP